MKKGDIILVPFPFTDLTGSKLRPALVLVANNIDVTIAFITTQIHWQEPTDIPLFSNVLNGLKQNSLIRLSKLATIDNKLVLGVIGEINTVEIQLINQNLILIFDIK